MSKVVTVRDVKIGVGAPKVIVPIVERGYSEIIGKVESFEGRPIDMVEWRADFFDELFDTERVLYTLSGLRVTLENTPLLFTFRTKGEGGDKEITWDAYTALNKAVAESGKADLVDVEVFSGDGVARENINNIHRVGCLAVGSNHDFHATPPAGELVSRLRKIQDMGADIAKVAVMPTCTADVLALLSATAEMYEKYATCPLITMSMSAKGVISRLSGEVFGSAATFGSVGKGSAPGQIPVEQLAQALDILHDAL